MLLLFQKFFGVRLGRDKVRPAQTSAISYGHRFLPFLKWSIWNVSVLFLLLKKAKVYKKRGGALFFEVMLQLTRGEGVEIFYDFINILFKSLVTINRHFSSFSLFLYQIT